MSKQVDSGMDISIRYAINAPEIVSEDFNGEIVILNLSNGHYFSLRGIACPIWSLLLAGYTPQSILESIASKRPELMQASSEFLARVADWTLVRPRTGDVVAAEPIDELWSGDAPSIEVFDDLAELVAADPIHEVDEQAGWPISVQRIES
jgi:hypothetical protein